MDNTHYHIIKIQDVQFEQPNAAVRKQLLKYQRGSYCKGTVISSVLLLITLFGLTVREYMPFCIMAVFFILIVWVPYMTSMLFLPKFTVRFGTVLHHEKKFDPDGSINYVTLRLEDTGEVVQDLPVTVVALDNVTPDAQVVLCRRKDRFSIYPGVLHR